jgi:hypothetical protein
MKNEKAKDEGLELRAPEPALELGGARQGFGSQREFMNQASAPLSQVSPSVLPLMSEAGEKLARKTGEFSDWKKTSL